MAKEHHCPNCGPQACNASTSKIHTCGVCAAVWEEVLGEGAPTPTAPAAATTPTKPTGPATPAAPAPKPAAPPAITAAPSSNASNSGPTSATAPAPQAAAPAQAAPLPAPTPGPTPPRTASPAEAKSVPAVATARPPAVRRLAEVIASAKVPRCPQCRSDNLAQPSDFLEVKGRIVLIDSQSYRGHQWFADTGEVYASPLESPAAAPPRASGTTAAASPAT